MKKQMFVLAAAILGMPNAWAATNSGASGASISDLGSGPNVRTNTYVNYEKYETRSAKKTYEVKDGKNLYYVQPSKRSEIYKNYKGCQDDACEKTVSQEKVMISRQTSARTEAKRKYYLAHPFFQPMKGKFGSVTDLASNSASYDMAITPYLGAYISDPDASWKLSQTAVKEDLSYGISDTVAIIGSARYSKSNYKMDWALPATPDDESSDSSIDVYGIGAQWRFKDTNEWIGTASAFYQKNVDIADTFILTGQAGYKVGNSTIYGLARLWYLDFKGTSYGDGLSDAAGNKFFVAYKTGDGTATYMEGGAGVFTVLDKDWTLNGEMLLGNYDWHNQVSVKGAIGWQPNDIFALNLYVKTALYDSANDKDLTFWYYDAALAGWGQIGTAKIDNYSETSFGLQGILYF